MDYELDAWVEVDLDAIKHNVEQIRSLVGDKVRIMAVVKANAYGHGEVETSRAILEAGADSLAVTRLEEAARLRDGGITAPALVFDSIQPGAAAEAVKLGVECTVCTPDLAAALGKAACAAHKTVGVHLKIDTGMGRLGVLPSKAVDLARMIAATEGIHLTGTYTHLAAAAEKDMSPAKEQLEKFNNAVLAIKQAFLDSGIVHAANSSAIIRMPDSHFDMVRPGTILYGQYPSRYVPRVLSMKDTWKLKARISFVKTVPAGYAIGYGSEHRTKRESRIAVIPLGWADGLTLAPESLARRGILRLIAQKLMKRTALTVIIRGKRAPVVGRIAMQMCSVDVTHIPDATIGDEVLIPARRVTTNPLLPRMYVSEDKQ